VKKPTITTSDERQHGSLRPRRWRTPVAVVCHGVLGSTSTGSRELGLAKAWKADDLVKG
jgi:hypothetical protein